MAWFVWRLGWSRCCMCDSVTRDQLDVRKSLELADACNECLRNCVTINVAEMDASPTTRKSAGRGMSRVSHVTLQPNTTGHGASHVGTTSAASRRRCLFEGLRGETGWFVRDIVRKCIHELAYLIMLRLGSGNRVCRPVVQCLRIIGRASRHKPRASGNQS